MSVEHVSLIDAAKRSVGMSFDGSGDPEADPFPEMTWRAGYGDKALGVMALCIDLETNNAKAFACELLTATLIIEQASEATFSFMIWAIENEDSAAWEAEGSPMPSEFSGRVEQVALIHVTPDGEAAWRANIFRSPDRGPTMGEWQLVQGRPFGRMRDGIFTGVKLGRRIPEDIASGLRDRMKTEGHEKVAANVMAAIQQARAEAIAELAKTN